jgi:asparagine synthase (glutamine-hydrolysing)
VIDGADPATVAAAVADGDPLPGTAGFAGRLPVPDGRLVRDVLGRRPLFSTPTGDDWSDDPRTLDAPLRLPAGHLRTPAAAGSGTGAADERAFDLPDPSPATDRGAAVERVREAVTTSVAEARADAERAGETLAVAFSGGVDSAVVAAGLPGAPAYVAGFDGAHDVAAARRAADATGADLRVVELTHDDLERLVPRVASATGRTNPMDVAIAVPLVRVAERAAADGADRLAVGQGADELFGGYAKVARAPDDPRVDADTVRGARDETVAGLPEQLERDVLALRDAGVEPVAPLLHDRVVRAAFPLPADLLVADGEDGDAVRKVALRRAARGLVPDAVRTADKKAVQYGSYVSRELDRLARRAGFKRRLDDHVGRYVRHLCVRADATVPDVTDDPLPGDGDLDPPT